MLMSRFVVVVGTVRGGGPVAAMVVVMPPLFPRVWRGADIGHHQFRAVFRSFSFVSSMAVLGAGGLV